MKNPKICLLKDLLNLGITKKERRFRKKHGFFAPTLYFVVFKVEILTNFSFLCSFFNHLKITKTIDLSEFLMVQSVLFYSRNARLCYGYYNLGGLSHIVNDAKDNLVSCRGIKQCLADLIHTRYIKASFSDRNRFYDASFY